MEPTERFDFIYFLSLQLARCGSSGGEERLKCSSGVGLTQARGAGWYPAPLCCQTWEQLRLYSSPLGPPTGAEGRWKEDTQSRPEEQPWQRMESGQGGGSEDGCAHWPISLQDWPRWKPHGASFKAMISIWWVWPSTYRPFQIQKLCSKQGFLIFLMVRITLEV